MNFEVESDASALCAAASEGKTARRGIFPVTTTSADRPERQHHWESWKQWTVAPNRVNSSNWRSVSTRLSPTGKPCTAKMLPERKERLLRIGTLGIIVKV